MTDSPESYAYRCLPLNIADSHGWEVLCPCDFAARWTGGVGAGDVELNIRSNRHDASTPISLFGLGTITFHIQGLFRTSPGWNLWVGGSPNYVKDGIAPLTGIVETDWSPFTFTMNWKLTRPGHWVEFSEGEPICFFFPLRRDDIAQVTPRFERMADHPEDMEQFRLWSESRNDFHDQMRRNPPMSPADKWQKLYYRGTDMRGQACPGHVAKLRLPEFRQPETRPGDGLSWDAPGYEPP